MQKNRLYSLDALRGFDMFWIMGVDVFFRLLATNNPNSFFEFLSGQLQHPKWHGFAFYDLIFPLFLFLSGVSLVYSVNAQIAKGISKKNIIKKMLIRTLILCVLGLIYNNGIVFKPLSEIRFGSVLSRIALASFFAGLIYLYTTKKTRLIWGVGILVFYWGLFLLFAAPGYVAGDVTMEGNIVSYLDRVLMPGKLYLTIHDPEGFVSTIPAITTALIGIYAGEIIRNGHKVIQELTSLALFLIGVALLWDEVFPINKNLWTSSFVLLCGGVSMLLMSLFYYVIDIRGRIKWAFFFRVIGMNAIVAYMSIIFIDWSFTNRMLFGAIAHFFGAYQPVFLAFTFVLLQWGGLYMLYRYKIFVKV